MPPTSIPYSYADPATALRAARSLESSAYEITRSLQALDEALFDAFTDGVDTERAAALAVAAAKLDLERAATALRALQTAFARLDRSASLRCPIPAGTEVL
jgi:hypothetical protein